MSLDKATVRNIAFLARIELPEEAIEPLVGELSSILGWIEQLQEVDTNGVEPMTSVAAMSLPWRDDVVADGNISGRVLANAPEAEDGFFLVPKVVE
ncbi:MAG: Asp-tRNA(Asn)/Glu-tRNA(Gln) amidotransferase subunit GatC [Alphaproteobacteria bacterium]